MSPDQSIPCPGCGFEIPIEPRDLLAGKECACPTCKKKVGLRNGAQGMAENTMARLAELRKMGGVAK